VHVSNINTLKSIYYAYFHSITKYGIIFWGTHPTMGTVSLHKSKLSELWPVHNPETHVEVYLNNQRVYLFRGGISILPIINFIINNQEIFQTHSSVHNINTRNKHHLRITNAKLSCFQKSPFRAGIKTSTVYHLV